MKCNSILVVEDDNSTRDILVELLRAESFEVDSADDGITAFLNLKKMAMPCLIFLDLLMPNMDGYEFLGKVKDKRASGAVLVVVMIALGNPKVNDVLLLRKPMAVCDVLEVVNKYCERVGVEDVRLDSNVYKKEILSDRTTGAGC